MKSKSFYHFISLLCTCSLIASCAKTPDVTDPSAVEVDLASFLESTEIPENLLIQLSEANIAHTTSAAVHKAKRMTFDKETLADALMKSEAYEEKLYAQGPQLLNLEKNEYLNTFDDGLAFEKADGEEYDIFSFSYISDSGNEKWQLVSDPQFTFSPFPTVELYLSNASYESKSDLSFKSYADVENEIIELLASIGINDVRVDETYSLNLETMQAQYESYRELNPDDPNSYTFTREDESYLFLFEQVIENIPIANKGYIFLPGSGDADAYGNHSPVSRVVGTYTDRGLKFLDSYQYYELIESGEPEYLISLTTALKKLVNEYAQVMLLEEISIISAELSYISIPQLDSADTFELRPVWIFSSMKKTLDNNEKDFIETRTDYVDAITSELVKGRF